MKKVVYLITPALLLYTTLLYGMKKETVALEQHNQKAHFNEDKKQTKRPTLIVTLLQKDESSLYLIRFLDQLIPTTWEFLQQCATFKAELNFFVQQPNNKTLLDTPGNKKIVWDITQLISHISNDLEQLLLYDIDETLNKKIRHNIAQTTIIQSITLLFTTLNNPVPFDQKKLFACIKIANILGNSKNIQRFASPLIFQLAPKINIPELRSFNDDENWFEQIILIPGTPLFLSYSDNGTIKLWDRNTPNELRTFNEHSYPINHIILIPNTTLFLICYVDGTIKLWDRNTTKSLTTFKESIGIIDQITPIPGTTRFLSYSNNTIKLWDHHTTMPLATFKESTGIINQIVLIPGTTRFLSCSSNTIKLYDWDTTKCLKTFNDHENCFEQIALIPDTTKFLSYSDDHTIKLWDWNETNALHTFNGHAHIVEQIVLIPGTTLFLSCSIDTIKLWDWNTSTSLGTFNENRGWIKQVTIIPGTTFFFSFSNKPAFTLWNRNKTNPLHTFNEHSDIINQIIPIPGTTQFLSCSTDHSAKLWDWNNHNSLHTWNDNINRVILIPETTFFLSCSQKSTKLWDYAPFAHLTFPQIELCYKLFSNNTKPHALLRETGDYELFMSLPQSIRDEAIKLKKVQPPFKAKTQPGQRPFKKTSKQQ